MKKSLLILTKTILIALVLCLSFTGCNPSSSGGESTTTVQTTVQDITTEVLDPYSNVNVVNEVPRNYLFNNGDQYFCSTGRLTGAMFVDYSADGGSRTNGGVTFNWDAGRRGGHFGHAMVEYEDGKILAFYPNCSDDNYGHCGRGWMEYKRSEDYGQTWSDPIIFQPSWDKFFGSGKNVSLMCEKALVTDDGTIIVFGCSCEVTVNPIPGLEGGLPDASALWEPYQIPTYYTSKDGGETWEGPFDVCSYTGRVQDAVIRNGTIYALVDAWEGKYHQLVVSTDGGKTFQERAKLPFPGECYYGTLGFLPSGELIAYTYAEYEDDEENKFDISERDTAFSVSSDGGRTWGKLRTTYFAKRLRNPQMVKFGNTYFMFGRSGNLGGAGVEGHHFVMYCSTDGINWDEGRYLRQQTPYIGTCFYSNTLVVGTFNPNVPDRLYVQASVAYKRHQTNIMYWWFDAYTLVKES